jgi:putative transposase
MRKTFLYRLRPTKAQVTRLDAMLEECRWLYNHLLEKRKAAYEGQGQSLELYDQVKTLPTVKKERPSLGMTHSQVLQNVALRVDLAYKAFFRRIKSGEVGGHPRFRGHGRYDSMCYPQYGSGNGANLAGDALHLSKVGSVKVVLHRPLEGTPKTVCIKRSSTGKWYATFSCEWEPTRLPESSEQVGIDVGLKTFAALSTGDEIANPRFFRTEKKAMSKASRQLSKQEKDTPQYTKRRKIAARVHERIRWRRDDFSHQHSRRIVNRFGLIAVEDLEVNRMLHNHCLSKSILDAAWSGFRSMIAVKAEWAGRIFVAVNPAYTSQTCSGCGHRLASDSRLSLGDRVFDCPCCQLHIDRDLNASLNILRLGQQSLASA